VNFPKAGTEPDSRRTLYILLSFAVAALLIRVAILAFDGNLYKLPVGDDAQYQGLAVSLATGKGFSLGGYDVINRMPGYPGLLALLYLVTGPSVAAARLLNVLLGVVCVPLAYRLGHKLWGRQVGLVTAGLLVVDPFHATAPLAVAPHNLLVPLITLLAVLLLARNQTILVAQLIGVVAALALMTHPSTLPILASVGLWYVFYSRSKKVPFRQYFFLAITFLLIMSSWAVRNWFLVGSFVPLTSGIESSGGGFVFWISNNHLTAQPGAYWGRFTTADQYPNMPDFGEYEAALASGDVTLLDRKGYELGLKFLTTHPEQIPSLLLGKFIGFWQPKLFAVRGEPIIPVVWLALAPLYAVGLWAHWRHSLRSRIAVAFVTGATVLALLYWGDPRFRAPVEAFLIIAAVLGALQIAAWVQRLLGRRLLAGQSDA
jgi:4-amino-4-deoxy-L-arabinose transferase-like glycosyltransferase